MIQQNRILNLLDQLNRMVYGPSRTLREVQGIHRHVSRMTGGPYAAIHTRAEQATPCPPPRALPIINIDKEQ